MLPHHCSIRTGGGCIVKAQIITDVPDDVVKMEAELAVFSGHWIWHAQGSNLPTWDILMVVRVNEPYNSFVTPALKLDTQSLIFPRTELHFFWKFQGLQDVFVTYTSNMEWRAMWHASKIVVKD